MKFHFDLIFVLPSADLSISVAGREGPEGHDGDEADEGLACETICPDIIWQKSIDHP